MKLLCSKLDAFMIKSNIISVQNQVIEPTNQPNRNIVSARLLRSYNLEKVKSQKLHLKSNDWL